MSLHELSQFYDTNGHVGTLFADVDDETGQVISTHLQIDSPNGDAGPVSVSMQVDLSNLEAMVAGFVEPLRAMPKKNARTPTVDLADASATALDASATVNGEADKAAVDRVRGLLAKLEA